MEKASLVGSLLLPPSPEGNELIELPDSVQWLEVRADLVNDLDPAWLRDRFGGKLLYSLRSSSEDGRFDGSREERIARLSRAATSYDLIDLEFERDLTNDLLNLIPAEKRLISWSGESESPVALQNRFEQLASTRAALYKLVVNAKTSADSLSPLTLLRSLNRTDVIAFSSSETGFWSRLLAARLGAPIVFGTVTRDPQSREPSVAQLIGDYGLPDLAHLRTLFGIIGSPVAHSLSPRLHNAAYRTLGLPNLFLLFPEESFADFLHGVVENEALESLGVPIKGLTVASPHKEAALELAAYCSPMVQQAGATNIFTRNGKGWKADTTDPEGAVAALRDRGIRIDRQKAAVIGCGGAGRSVAAALSREGADVTLVNRGSDRGIHARSLLGLPFVPLSKFCADDYSTLVNATPVGRNGEELPFTLKRIKAPATVVDLAYGRETTPLTYAARSQGLTAVDGYEVLLIQVRRQFRMMTGMDLPLDVAEEVLGFRPAELVAAH